VRQGQSIPVMSFSKAVGPETVQAQHLSQQSLSKLDIWGCCDVCVPGSPYRHKWGRTEIAGASSQASTQTQLGQAAAPHCVDSPELSL